MKIKDALFLLNLDQQKRISLIDVLCHAAIEESKNEMYTSPENREAIQVKLNNAKELLTNFFHDNGIKVFDNESSNHVYYDKIDSVDELKKEIKKTKTILVTSYNMDIGFLNESVIKDSIFISIIFDEYNALKENYLELTHLLHFYDIITNFNTQELQQAKSSIQSSFQSFQKAYNQFIMNVFTKMIKHYFPFYDSEELNKIIFKFQNEYLNKQKKHNIRQDISVIKNQIDFHIRNSAITKAKLKKWAIKSITELENQIIKNTLFVNNIGKFGRLHNVTLEKINKCLEKDISQGEYLSVLNSLNNIILDYKKSVKNIFLTSKSFKDALDSEKLYTAKIAEDAKGFKEYLYSLYQCELESVQNIEELASLQQKYDRVFKHIDRIEGIKRNIYIRRQLEAVDLSRDDIELINLLDDIIAYHLYDEVDYEILDNYLLCNPDFEQAVVTISSIVEEKKKQNNGIPNIPYPYKKNKTK